MLSFCGLSGAWGRSHVAEDASLFVVVMQLRALGTLAFIGKAPGPGDWKPTGLHPPMDG